MKFSRSCIRSSFSLVFSPGDLYSREQKNKNNNNRPNRIPNNNNNHNNQNKGLRSLLALITTLGCLKFAGLSVYRLRIRINTVLFFYSF